jgi:4-coumarate--CoA ligase (photoactive yellow protein activation family)
MKSLAMLDRPAISRVLQDRIAAEMTALRGGNADALPRGPWSETMGIGAGLGVDSLEMMALAGAVNEFFHVQDTGVEDMLLARRQFGDWVDLAQHACRADGARISFRSSGSTGSPKRCTHSLRALADEAAEHLGRMQPGRIFAAVPGHHIYGFIFSALMPSLSGCEVVNMRAHVPDKSVFRAGDLIVSFPDHWRFLARSYEHLPAITGVTSAAPMQAELAREIASHGLRLIEIYGASETAGIGWRDDPDAPFMLLDRWQVDCAPAAPGVLTLIDAGGNHVATPDEVAMQGNRSFHLLGRLDGAVQVGGINVYPARIAAMLKSHALISEARVQFNASAQGGHLSALLVPKDPAADVGVLRSAIQAWISATLSPPEQPKSLIFTSDAGAFSRAKQSGWSTVEGFAR